MDGFWYRHSRFRATVYIQAFLSRLERLQRQAGRVRTRSVYRQTLRRTPCRSDRVREPRGRGNHVLVRVATGGDESVRVGLKYIRSEIFRDQTVFVGIF